MCAGTVDGGKRAAATNKERYGEDYFEKIGAKGGKNGHTGGFYANRELARTAGALAGKVSKRGHRYLFTRDGFRHYIALDTGKVVQYPYDSKGTRTRNTPRRVETPTLSQQEVAHKRHGLFGLARRGERKETDNKIS